MAWQVKPFPSNDASSRITWEIVSEEQTHAKTALGQFRITSHVKRAKVPGGWFVRVGGGASQAAFFYPDPNHEWDGGSLP